MTATELYVDISSHNGTPDLKAYWDAGHRTLCLKATEGTGYSWPLMQQLARQWHSFGPGARCIYYHWLYGTFTGTAQFNWFWSHVSPVFRAGDMLMTDFEDVDVSRWVSDEVHLHVVKEFNALCDQKALTLDYAPNWYLANMPLCIAYFKTRKLWVPSDYSHDPPLNPHGFTAAAHQFTDRATVAGIAGPVDYNRWIAQPTTGDDMSAADVAAIEAYIDRKFDGLTQQIFDKIFKTDGVFAGPTPINPNNPTLALQSIINLILNYSHQAALSAAAAASSAASANKVLTSTDPKAPGVLARVAATQAQVMKLPTTTGAGGPVDLTAVTEAARSGAAAGASLDGKTLTIHDGGTA